MHYDDTFHSTAPLENTRGAPHRNTQLLTCPLRSCAPTPSAHAMACPLTLATLVLLLTVAQAQINIPGYGNLDVSNNGGSRRVS